MAKKNKTNAKAERKTKARKKKNFSQNALPIVERLIGGNLVKKKRR